MFTDRLRYKLRIIFTQWLSQTVRLARTAYLSVCLICRRCKCAQIPGATNAKFAAEEEVEKEEKLPLLPFLTSSRKKSGNKAEASAIEEAEIK